MKISDLLALSFENLRRRVGRTVLTVVGVVVGTCSIVVMVSLGIAMNEGFDEMLQQWGDLTVINVYNWSAGSEAPKLDDAMVEKLNQMKNVSVATPQYSSRYLNLQMVSGTNDRYQLNYTQVVGMYPEAVEALGFSLASGTYLQAEKNPSTLKKIPILIGENTGYQFTDSKKRNQNSYRYPGQTDANGNELPPFVDINTAKMSLKSNSYGDSSMKDLRYDVSVVGVMVSDYSKGYVTDSGIVMDLNVLKALEKEYMRANNIKADENNGYDNITVKVDDVKNVEAVEAAIQEYGYQTYSMSSERERMREQAQLIQVILGGLGAVSLFVAALSIANTMTMAIYERTREIGVMKVLGCELGRIRVMFLFEAAMIGFVGGIVGVIISYLMSFGMNYFAPYLMSSGIGNFLPIYGSKVSVIPMWLAFVGLGFSTLIGVLSGIMPANRAVKISALEAIRHE